MRTLFLALTIFILLPPVARANDGTDDTKPLEIPDFSKAQNPSKQEAKTTVTGICTDGRTFNVGDVGYESCLMNAQTNAQRQYAPATDKSKKQTGPSVGFKVGQ